MFDRKLEMKGLPKPNLGPTFVVCEMQKRVENMHAIKNQSISHSHKQQSHKTIMNKDKAIFSGYVHKRGSDILFTSYSLRL